jgi:Flp pilus assembly protein TadD
VLEIHPDYFEAQLGLAVALFHLGSYDEAVGEFKNALDLDPENPRVHYGLGMSYLQAGDRESAVAEYKILNETDSALAEDLYKRFFD